MPRIQLESFPVQNISDGPTRDAIDRLQRAMQFAFAPDGLATQDDLAALKSLVSSTAQTPTRSTTVIKPPAAANDSRFVRIIGDTMTGALFNYIETVSDITSEAHGINQVKRTTHDRIEAWSNATTYGKYEVAASAGIIWQSLQGANTNHTPASSPTWWTNVATDCNTFIRENWSNVTAYDPPTYLVNSTVAHGGKVYQSLYNAATNTGIEPGVTAGWQNFWQLLDDHVVSGPVYAIGDVVVWGIGLYTSLINANSGNIPHLNPDKWEASVPVGVGMQCNSFGTNSNGFGVTFGIACEAWNGYYPRPDELGVPTRADRRLIAIEPSVINRNPRSFAAKVAGDFTFKNRADTEFAVAMPLGPAGEDRYNINARATQFSSFPRSSTGEKCGWPTLFKVNQNATDISANQPFTVIMDMYDQSVGNDGDPAGTWWWWWATGIGPSGGQPLGYEGGIRYNQASQMIEFYANIVDGTTLACTIDMTRWNPTHIMTLNSGNFPMRVGLEESLDMVSVGWNSGTNFVSAAANGALANPFTVPANIFPTGFWSFWIDGVHRKFGYYNP